MQHPRILNAVAAAIALTFGLHAAAQEATTPVFTLGQISVVGQTPDGPALATDTLDAQQLQDFSKDGLADALNLVPGVASTAGSGRRNEALISVRGFDRWQVPLLMDGIRLYLPADNRIDFDRFITPDLAEIQVSKGYVSVLNGPDGMGGAINLVTRKPVKPFEAEVRSSLLLGGNGQYNGSTLYANVGARQEGYYLQASAEQRVVDQWALSHNFVPTAYEDGGDRDHSDKRDWRVNLKAGLTPNAVDEYSLNFVTQSGKKSQSGSTEAADSQWWDWPKWDTWSLYALTRTELSPGWTLKTKLYYNAFVNDLLAYTVKTGAKNWISHYDDNAKGASAELGTTVLPQQTLKAALHWRRDDHTEWQTTYATDFTEPKQNTVEDVYSVALEDTWRFAPGWQLVGGLSRDQRKTQEAQEYASGTGLFDQPTADSHATNGQAALLWQYRAGGKLHLSASDRTRFPTMFERFSSRFGGAISNPGLKPERALNLELGIEDDLAPGWHGTATLFHSQVKDAIQSVNIDYNGSTYSQSQNVGKATYRGLELGLSATLTSTLAWGGNYSYVVTSLDNPNDDTARLTTTPRNKALLWARWQPLPELSVMPNLEYSGARWSSAATGSGYTRLGAYPLWGLKAALQLTPTVELSLAARNLLDRNCATTAGYPQEGRNFVLTALGRF